MSSEFLHFTPQVTADGSFTFFSPEFGECFHSRQGAKLEAEQKFVVPLQLAQKATQPVIKLLDICYGLGYNTAAALATIWQINPDCQVQWWGLELVPGVPQAAIRENLLREWPAPIPEILTTLGTQFRIKTDYLDAKLLIGDARVTLHQVIESGFLADAIFLDPFSPPTCPQLWTVEFLGLVSHCLKPDGKLATYSCAAAVRRALQMAGLQIGSTAPIGRKSPGTLASFSPLDLFPLSVKEQEHLNTRAAIPYRDPSLTDPATLIHQRREQEQQISSLEPTSQWKKRGGAEGQRGRGAEEQRSRGAEGQGRN